MSELQPIEPIEARRVPPPRITALDRAAGFLRWLAGRVHRLALLALAGAVLVWWAAFVSVPEGDRIVPLTLLAILLVLPPPLLGLFGFAVRGLAALPARFREAPGQTRERIVEVRRQLAEMAGTRRRGPFSGLRGLARLGWSLRSSREVLEVAGPAAVVLTPGMLAATGVALIAGLTEVLAGVIALVWLALR